MLSASLPPRRAARALRNRRTRSWEPVRRRGGASSSSFDPIFRQNAIERQNKSGPFPRGVTCEISRGIVIYGGRALFRGARASIKNFIIRREDLPVDSRFPRENPNYFWNFTYVC